VEDVCGCDVTPFFEAHVRRGGRPIDFDRYLAALGLRTRVTWAPAVWNGQPERDLRIFGWNPPDEPGVRLVISDPGSAWGRAGFHSGDRLTAVDGRAVASWPDVRARLQQLQIGDTIRLAVARPTGSHAATVRVSGFDRPIVRVEEVPGATDRQRAMKQRWMREQ
jgi:predicted metalloprotease with PDZ domain